MFAAYTKHKEIINYVIFGVLTTAVCIISYYICVLTFLDPKNPLQLQIANVLSWIAAVVFAYYTNRKYVFLSREKNIIKEGTAFFVSRISTLIMDMAIMFLLVTVLCVNDKIAKLIVQIIVIIGNYLLSKWVVFKNK